MVDPPWLCEMRIDAPGLSNRRTVATIPHPTLVPEAATGTEPNNDAGRSSNDEPHQKGSSAKSRS